MNLRTPRARRTSRAQRTPGAQGPARTGATLVAAAALGALVLTGCGTVTVGSRTVDVGPIATEQRDVDAATAIELATSGDVTVTRGDTASLTITAGEGILPHLTSDVEDGVLVLGVDDEVRWGSPGRVEYELVLPELEAISITGSGDVSADGATGELLVVNLEGSGGVQVRGVDVEAVSVAIAGSGGVDLAGRAESQDVSIEGSGSYSGGSLATSAAVVAIDGSGGATLDVSSTLEVAIGGSGSVTYTGDAEVTKDIDGSGDVRRR